MSISFYDFKTLHHRELQATVRERFEQINADNSFIEGPYNNLFEREFAQLQGAQHCLLVANGTDALEISLQALELEPGAYVGVPGITFYASAEAVINRGLRPVLIDVDPQTGLICLESFKRMQLKFPMQAVMPVHIYGLPAPIQELNEFCDTRQIAIIEDGAQAQGGHFPHGPIGSSPNLTCFSFYPTKNLSAFGDAGAILTQSEQLRDKILMIRNHGRSPQGHALVGRNSRCDHLQAAVLHAKLQYIDQWNQSRRQLAEYYLGHLQGLPLRLLPESFIPLSSWHQFPIGLSSTDEKVALKDYLQREGIESMFYYPKALSEEAPLQHIPGEREHAERFAQTTLCLPIHPTLGLESAQKVCEVIHRFFKNCISK